MDVACRVGTDSVDDYLSTGESTIIESLKRFVKAVVSISPNDADMARFLSLSVNMGCLRC